MFSSLYKHDKQNCFPPLKLRTKVCGSIFLILKRTPQPCGIRKLISIISLYLSYAIRKQHDLALHGSNESGSDGSEARDVETGGSSSDRGLARRRSTRAGGLDGSQSRRRRDGSRGRGGLGSRRGRRLGRNRGGGALGRDLLLGLDGLGVHNDGDDTSGSRRGLRGRLGGLLRVAVDAAGNGGRRGRGGDGNNSGRVRGDNLLALGAARLALGAVVGLGDDKGEGDFGARRLGVGAGAAGGRAGRLCLVVLGAPCGVRGNDLGGDLAHGAVSDGGSTRGDGVSAGRLDNGRVRRGVLAGGAGSQSTGCDGSTGRSASAGGDTLGAGGAKRREAS